MSFLLHKEFSKLDLSPRLSRTAINQLEVLRRSFELKTPDLIAAILENGIGDEFDRRMSEIGALPEFDTPEPHTTPADRYLSTIMAATQIYFREALTPAQQISEAINLPDVKIARALSHAAAQSDDPSLAFMRMAAIGSTEPGGNADVDEDPEYMIGVLCPEVA